MRKKNGMDMIIKPTLEEEFEEFEGEWLNLLMDSAYPSLVAVRRFLQRWGDSYSTLDYLVRLHPSMDRDEWLTLVGEVWTCADNVSEHLEDLKNMLPRRTAKQMMDLSEISKLRTLPSNVTIYRGCGEVNIDGACWSLDRAIASRFPTLARYRADVPLLITATVLRKEIIAVKLDRDEAEVITFSARVQSITRLP